MALCVGWLVYDVAAQTNDATDDGTLTVGKCLANANISEAAAKGTNRHLFGDEALVALRLGEEADDIAAHAQYPVGPVEEALIKEDIIAETLLPAKITDGMCEDMLERAPDGTLVQSLVAAQNYIQEIKLIENSILEAEGEAAAKGNDRHPSSVSFILARATAETIEGPAQAQYPPSDGNSTSTATATSTATSNAGGGGGGGGTGETTVSGERRQAAQASAMAAAAVAEGDASIADMLNRLEAAGLSEGLSRSEAAHSARCALEEAQLNVISKKLSQGQYMKVSPDQTPKEMEYEHSVTIKLLVSGDVGGLYEELGRKYEKIAEASEAEKGCVLFVKSMSARLLERDFAVDPHQSHETRPITRDTTWSWDVTANSKGKNSMDLFVGHVLQSGELELRPHWVEPAPVRHAVITVNARPLRDKSNWLWLLPIGVALAVAATWLVVMLRKNEQSSSAPGNEG
jgi:hypothetical protein